MKWREAPRLVIDPGPAPRIDPGPVAFAIRCPTAADAAGKPDAAVRRLRTPSAVAVEVLVSDHVGRYIARGNGARVTPIAIERPALERIGRGQREEFAVADIGAMKAVGLSRGDDIRRVLAVDLAGALAHRDGRRAILWIDVDAITTRPRQREREIRRVDLDDIARRQLAHAHVERPLLNLHLRDAVIEVRHRHARLRTEPPRAVVDADFRARIAVGPNAIAGDERAVDLRLHPLVAARR